MHPTLEVVPDHEDAGRLEAVLRNIVSVGCMSETVAVSLIRAEQAELAKGPLAHVLDTILADEIAHARFGWKALGQLLPMLDADARERLDRYLVDALAHQVVVEVPKLGGQHDPARPLADVGICDAGFARSLFVDTIESVIVPGLARVGLRSHEAWREARARTTHLLAS